MKATIAKQYSFSAGHYLPNVPDDHPCHAQHGHNYVVEVRVRGEIDKHLGWVIDFNVMDTYIKVFIDLLDHINLNDIEGLKNPTAEHIASWILLRIQRSALYDLGAYSWTVKVWETPKCWAEVST